MACITTSTRRGFLGMIGRLGVAIVGLLAGAGCGRNTPAPPAEETGLRVDELLPGRRITIRWRDQPVELHRTAAGIEARSLICSHMSCVVRWDAASERYLCPCHDGAFDAQGRPVAGPPLRPLRRLRVSEEGGLLRLDEIAPRATS